MNTNTNIESYYYDKKSEVNTMNNEIKKETAIQNEQQLKSKQITNKIINILVDNSLSIIESKNILDSVLNKLDQQKVTNTSTGWVDAKKYIK